MASSANALMKEMQKIASNAQIEVQKLANEATEKSFKYNAEEATTARKWQKEMSDTSHQREVEDLKKAGLNPVLSSNSGAQSYTTSSASSQANDPSGSIGALAGNLIQSRTNAYSADTSAAATRAAAAQSASAMRYSAQQAASAQKYAAYMNYMNNREHEKWQNNYLEKETEAKIKVVQHTPVKSVGGFLDKLAENTGLYGLTKTKAVHNTVSGMQKFLNDIGSNPNKYFSNNSNITKNNFTLNNNGKSFVNNMLYKFNLPQNKTTRQLFIKAVVFRDPTAFAVFKNYGKNRNVHRYTGIQI